MDITLNDLYVVITGASSGLGFAMAQALLEKGATVALASRSGERLDNAVNEFGDVLCFLNLSCLSTIPPLSKLLSHSHNA